MQSPPRLAMVLATPALPQAIRAPSASLLRFVPTSYPLIPDPILTSTCITRNHGCMIFDQLSACP